MSSGAPTLERPAAPPPELFTKTRRHRRARDLPAYHPLLFGGSFAVYFALGCLTVLRWHIVIGDAVSRLAHAYFVWFNEPPKLVAIGFVWPPLMTVVFLPFAAVKPLATSLFALPLMSAVFGAALVVSLDRTLDLLGMTRRARLPLIALIALNPMILFYAGNGMSELVYLFLLAFGVDAFLRWYLTPRPALLVLASFAFALGLLTRYEILLWALVVGVAVVAVLVRRGASRAELEGVAVAFFAPIFYSLGLWVFFNWLILGSPFAWLHSEVTLTFVETRRVLAKQIDTSPLAAGLHTLSLTWHLFPATVFVVALLAARFVWRRDLVALMLAAVVGLNALTTFAFVVGSRSDVAFQLRYNLRSLPLALIGMAWLYRGARRPALVWCATAVLFAASVPSTWRMMETYRLQSQEQAFTRALTSGDDQEGTRSLGAGVRVGNAPERAAARWIDANVHGRDAILADDAESFAVMLYTGRPGLFLDRIDRGDDAWYDVLNTPYGRVRYFLVPRRHFDLIQKRYPTVLDGGVPFLRTAYRNPRWLLLRVAAGPAR